MRKFTIALLIITLFAGLGYFAGPADATWVDNAFNGNLELFAEQGAGYGAVANGEDAIYALVGRVIQTLLSLLGIIFLGLMIYGGFIWMTARGEEAKVDSAKSIIKNSIIGLGIVIIAYSISYFVLSKMIAGLIKS